MRKGSRCKWRFMRRINRERRRCYVMEEGGTGTVRDVLYEGRSVR